MPSDSKWATHSLAQLLEFRSVHPVIIAFMNPFVATYDNNLFYPNYPFVGMTSMRVQLMSVGYNIDWRVLTSLWSTYYVQYSVLEPLVQCAILTG